MSPGHIRQGIRDYAHEQEVLRRVLRKHGDLSTEAFDRIFREFREELRADGVRVVRARRGKVRFCPTSPKAFILGSYAQGEWSKWLELLQHMCRLGEVTTFKRDGILYYRRVN
jgi:hypothetical protein